MSNRKQVITFQGVQYLNYGPRIPKQGSITKQERDGAISAGIAQGVLKPVGSNRPVNKRPPSRRHCTQWEAGPKPRARGGRKKMSTALVPYVAPAAKKMSMAEKMAYVRSFRKTKK